MFGVTLNCWFSEATIQRHLSSVSFRVGGTFGDNGVCEESEEEKEEREALERRIERESIGSQGGLQRKSSRLFNVHTGSVKFVATVNAKKK